MRTKAEKKNQPDNRAGWTLIEAMTVIGIVSVVSMISIPNIIGWFPDQRLKKAARELHSNFQLAKMTAVKTGVCCTFVFGQQIDGKEYDYVVFEDANCDLEYDSGEKIVEKVLWSDYRNVSVDIFKPGRGVTFAKNDHGKPAMAFRPNGLPVENGGGLAAGTVYLESSVGTARKVVVSPAGNVRIEY